MASISEYQELEPLYCHIEDQAGRENMFLAIVNLSIRLHCDCETLLQIYHSISDSKSKASYNAHRLSFGQCDCCSQNQRGSMLKRY